MISILVPVYNVERFLPICLDSLIGQTYSDLEIILVDDGSTDASGEICENYASMDPRIQVIHQENRGVSVARNHAIEAATGDWVLWVDSDDFIARNACEVFLECANKTGADVVVAQDLRFQEESDIKLTSFNTIEVVDSEEGLRRYFYRVISGYHCSKLYRKKLIEDIRYPEGKIFEDCYVVPEYLERAERIAITDAVLYYYRQVNNSIVHSSYNSEKLNAVDAIEQTQLNMSNYGKEMRIAIQSKKFVTCADLLGRMQGVAGYDADRKRLVKGINDTKKTVLFDSNNTLFVRIMALVAMVSPSILGWASGMRGAYLKKRV